MGYFLLALVIERASNRTYEQFLRDEFFAALGLDDTSAAEAMHLFPRDIFVTLTLHG